MSSEVHRLPCSIALAVSALVGSISAQHCVGVVVDRGRSAASPLGGREPYVHVFDPDTMQITGSVMLPIPPFANVFDVEISADLSRAYVSDNGVDQVWVIDLTTSPPTLASGTNPIQVVIGTLDLALSPNGRWLACGGGENVGLGGTGISIVDTATHQQTDIIDFRIGAGTCPVAIEFAPDGSLIVNEQTFTSPSQHEARLLRYRIDGSGHAHATGDTLGPGTIPGSQNLIVPHYPFLPRFLDVLVSRHVVAVARPAGGVMTSLRANSLVPVASETLDFPSGIDLDFDHYRSIVYVRTIESPTSGPAGAGNSQIAGYFFSPLTGRFGPRVVSIAMDVKPGTAYGVEQMAIDPASRRLFVSGLARGEIRVFDSLTGQQLGAITDPDFLFGLGVAVRRR